MKTKRWLKRRTHKNKKKTRNRKVRGGALRGAAEIAAKALTATTATGIIATAKSIEGVGSIVNMAIERGPKSAKIALQLSLNMADTVTGSLNNICHVTNAVTTRFLKTAANLATATETEILNCKERENFDLKKTGSESKKCIITILKNFNTRFEKTRRKEMGLINKQIEIQNKMIDRQLKKLGCSFNYFRYKRSCSDPELNAKLEEKDELILQLNEALKTQLETDKAFAINNLSIIMGKSYISYDFLEKDALDHKTRLELPYTDSIFDPKKENEIEQMNTYKGKLMGISIYLNEKITDKRNEILKKAKEAGNEAEVKRMNQEEENRKIALMNEESKIDNEVNKIMSEPPVNENELDKLIDNTTAGVNKLSESINELEKTIETEEIQKNPSIKTAINTQRREKTRRNFAKNSRNAASAYLFKKLSNSQTPIQPLSTNGTEPLKP